MINANERAATAPTVTTLNSPALAGGTNTNPVEELTMQGDTTSAPVGATTRISDTLGAAYRSGAKTVDQLLVELMDRFVEDAKAIDPTIIGAWVGRDMTARNRDPHGAVQSIFLERENARIVRKAGA